MSKGTQSAPPTEWLVPPRKLDPLAGILSYLLPGLGQVVQGRIGKGLLFFFCIYTLFFWGLAIGHWKNVYLPRADDPKRFRPSDAVMGLMSFVPRPLVYRFQYVGQFWVGVAAWPALLQWLSYEDESSIGFKRGDAIPHPLLGTFMRTPLEAELNRLQTEGDKNWEIGWTFTVVAGFLNLLVIYDAFAGAAFHTPIRRQSAPEDLDLSVQDRRQAVKPGTTNMAPLQLDSAGKVTVVEAKANKNLPPSAGAGDAAALEVASRKEPTQLEAIKPNDAVKDGPGQKNELKEATVREVIGQVTTKTDEGNQDGSKPIALSQDVANKEPSRIEALNQVAIVEALASKDAHRQAGLSEDAVKQEGVKPEAVKTDAIGQEALRPVSATEAVVNKEDAKQAELHGNVVKADAVKPEPAPKDAISQAAIEQAPAVKAVTVAETSSLSAATESVVKENMISQEIAKNEPVVLEAAAKQLITNDNANADTGNPPAIENPKAIDPAASQDPAKTAAGSKSTVEGESAHKNRSQAADSLEDQASPVPPKTP